MQTEERDRQYALLVKCRAQREQITALREALREIRLEITRVNSAFECVIFNPAATTLIDSLLPKQARAALAAADKGGT